MLSEDVTQQIRTLNEEGFSNTEIAKKLNIPLRTVQRKLNNTLFSVSAWEEENGKVVYIDGTRYSYPGEWKLDRAILAALKKSRKISIAIYKNYDS